MVLQREEIGQGREIGLARVRPVLLICLLLALSLGIPACESSIFDPPDTRVVGQTLGTLLAVSYAASLTHHALTVGNSSCYERTLSNSGSPVDAVTIGVTKECGFPFPGVAEGSIRVAGFGVAGTAPGFGVADFSTVRVDGRPLTITRATGYLAVSIEEAPQHGVPKLPDSDTLLAPPTNPVIIIYADLDFTGSPNTDHVDKGRIDEWFGLISRGHSLDDFSDDAYWFGGQRASFSASGGEVAQEFAAFSPDCRANPQMGFVQLVRASEVVEQTGMHYLAFVPECKGAGYVVLSLSKNLLSSGRHASLDLLGGK